MSINVLESDERFRSPVAAFRQAGSLGGIDRIGQIFGLAPDVNHVAISDVLRYHPVRGGAPHRILARIFGAISRQLSNSNSLVLVERGFLVAPVVELGGAGRGVVRHLLGVLQGKVPSLFRSSVIPVARRL